MDSFRRSVKAASTQLPTQADQASTIATAVVDLLLPSSALRWACKHEQKSPNLAPRRALTPEVETIVTRYPERSSSKIANEGRTLRLSLDPHSQFRLDVDTLKL